MDDPAHMETNESNCPEDHKNYGYRIQYISHGFSIWKVNLYKEAAIERDNYYTISGINYIINRFLNKK